MNKILSKTSLLTNQAKWISLQKLTYSDKNGKVREWECAERTTRKDAAVDAVSIFSILKGHPGKPAQTILITQYRPPVDAFVVEFPAGLVDSGESPEEAALRELNEETGYSGTVRYASKTLVSDPGMTNANMMQVVVDVDTTLVENANPKPQLEEGEHMDLHLVELDGLLEKLKDFSDRGFAVDARLYHLAEGLAFKV